MKLLPVLAACGFAAAGCASPRTAATTVAAPAHRQPAVAASTVAIDQAASNECATGRSIALTAVHIASLPTGQAEAQMDALSPTWQRELTHGESAANVPGVPTGRNKARVDAVALAGLAVALDFADTAYESGEQVTATTDYTKFIKLLGKMARKDCAG